MLRKSLLCTIAMALGFTTNAFAVLNVTITSPSDGATVSEDFVYVEYSITGAVAGISEVRATGEGSFTESYSFPYSPPTSNHSDTYLYLIPGSAAAGEELTVTVTARGHADPQASDSITLIKGGDPTPTPTPTPAPLPAGVIQLNGEPTDAVYDADRGQIYVTNLDDGQVDILDIGGKALTGSLTYSGSDPDAIDISMDGTTLVVADGDTDTVQAIDLATGQAGNSGTSGSTDHDPADVVFRADGKVFVTHSTSQSYTYKQVDIFDPADGSVTSAGGAGLIYSYMGRSDDYTTFYHLGSVQAGSFGVSRINSDYVAMAVASITNEAYTWDVSPDGLYYTQNSSIYDADFDKVLDLTDGTKGVFLPGHMIVTLIFNNMDGFNELKVFSATTGDEVQSIMLPMALTGTEGFLLDCGQGLVVVFDTEGDLAMFVNTGIETAASGAWSLYR